VFAYTTLLFVPGNRPDRFAKATASGADAVILDLEDAVADADKDVARASVCEALGSGLRAIVRTNAVESPAGERDLAALAHLPLAAVMLPKTSGANDVDRARSLLPDVSIIALVESVRGMRAIDAIAGAGVDAIVFGGYDLCAELGARPTPDVLAPWRSRVVFAARSANVAAIDTPFADIGDLAGLAADAGRTVDFGFDAKLAIHPSQIAPIRDAFTPGARDVERARGIVAAATGGGVNTYEGTMIDMPLVIAARRVLARAGASA